MLGPAAVAQIEQRSAPLMMSLVEIMKDPLSHHALEQPLYLSSSCTPIHRLGQNTAVRG